MTLNPVTSPILRRQAIAMKMALVLCLLSGAALAEFRHVAWPSHLAATGDDSDNANEALIRRFYSAVNTAFATDNVDPLEEMLARDFVEHHPRPGLSADRTGFFESLRMLKVVAPGLRLQVLDVVVEDDLAAVRVGVGGDAIASMLGHPIPTSQLWAVTDVFRVEDGWIVEHWGDEASLSMLTPLLSAEPVEDHPVRTVVALEQWTFEPADLQVWSTGLGMLSIVVETGTVTISVDIVGTQMQRSDGERRESVPAGETISLQAGEALIVGEGGKVTFLNDHRETATLLAVIGTIPAPNTGAMTGLASPPEPDEIRRTVIVGGISSRLPDGELLLSIGRITIAPGAMLLPGETPAVELIAVESGRMSMTAEGGEAWVAVSPAEVMRQVRVGTFATGSAVTASSGAVTSIGAMGDAPLGVLIVTIRPLDSSGASFQPHRSGH